MFKWVEKGIENFFQRTLCFHTAGYLGIFCTLNRINEICDFFGLAHFNWNYLSKKITERSVNLSRVNFENLFCRIGLKIIFFRLISIIQFDQPELDKRKLGKRYWWCSINTYWQMFGALAIKLSVSDQFFFQIRCMI